MKERVRVDKILADSCQLCPEATGLTLSHGGTKDGKEYHESEEPFKTCEANDCQRSCLPSKCAPLQMSKNLLALHQLPALAAVMHSQRLRCDSTKSNLDLNMDYAQCLS